MLHEKAALRSRAACNAAACLNSEKLSICRQVEGEQMPDTILTGFNCLMVVAEEFANNNTIQNVIFACTGVCLFCLSG